MTTKSDIEFWLMSEEAYFSCKKCKTRFGHMPFQTFMRWKMQRIEDQEANKIVDRHLLDCPGPTDIEPHKADNS